MNFRYRFAFCVFIILVIAAGLGGCSNDKKSVDPNPQNQVFTVNLVFEEHVLDLETGKVDTVMFTYEAEAEMDFSILYNNSTTPRSVVAQQETLGRMIAHLPNRTFASVTLSDTAGATFTSTLNGDPFDVSRVILIKTDSSNVYKLGNPVETSDFDDGLTLNYQRLSEGP